MTDPLTFWSVVAALVLLNALFVAAEFAIVAAPRARISRLADTGSRAAALVRYVQSDARRQDRYIAAAQVGITAASLGLGMYGEHGLAQWLRPHLAGLGWLQEPAAHSLSGGVAVLFLTYLHVVLGEMVPKSLALFRPEKTVLTVSTPMLLFSRLALPLVLLLNGVGNLILRAFRIPLISETASVHSPRELELIVEESHEQGTLGEQESEILVNLLHFRDLLVRKVMVPRTSVVGIPLDCGVDEAVRIAVETRHTRYPVYGESLDDIRGILHVKELFRELRRPQDQRSIADAMRPAVFVPEQLTLEELLVEFQKRGAQVAVVLDEYGGTAGMVTLEDVLEEIFGEVQDEFDEEEPAIQRLDERRWALSGRVRLDEFEEETGIAFQREDVDTMGGLALALLGRPPAVGDEVELEGVRMRVTALDGLAVGRLEVEFPAVETESGDTV
ncbi:MAG: hemolysin family protein [Armatimonadota bacterium]